MTTGKTISDHDIRENSEPCGLVEEKVVLFLRSSRHREVHLDPDAATKLGCERGSIDDLLDTDHYGRLVRRPKPLDEERPPETKLIIIDEIQKLPGLLEYTG